ncbi:MAG: exosortase H-associated membrane protein [Pseudomonadota bacterium]
MNLLFARFGVWIERRPLLRFVAAVLALLPAAFVLWHALAAELAAPATLVTDAVLRIWLPNVVEQTSLQGHDLLIVSTYGESGGRIMAAQNGVEPLVFAINTRLLSYSVPFYAALYFASPMRGGIDRFAWGMVILWLLLTVGLLAVATKDLMFGLGALFLELPATPSPEAIALSYQLSTLLVPTLGPMLLWAYAARDSEAFLSLLGSSRRPAQSSD